MLLSAAPMSDTLHPSFLFTGAPRIHEICQQFSPHAGSTVSLCRWLCLPVLASFLSFFLLNTAGQSSFFFFFTWAEAPTTWTGCHSGLNELSCSLDLVWKFSLRLETLSKVSRPQWMCVVVVRSLVSLRFYLPLEHKPNSPSECGICVQVLGVE